MNNNNMKKDIYGGINPVFESLRSSLNEGERTSRKTKAIDTMTAVVTALNTLFSLILSSKMEDAKTVRGFESIKNKILSTDNFGSFRQYLISFIESLAVLDPGQKQAYDSNLKMITSILSGEVEAVLGDPKMYKSIKNDTIAKVLENFSNDLKDRENQMRKTNPKLFGEVIKKGLVVKEGLSEKRKTGDESDATEGEFRGQAFNKSKESLDAANSFVGMVDRDKYLPNLKDNSDIKRYKEIADSLYKKAQELQMVDRAGALGGKIVTPSGEFKAGEYKRKQDDLVNEIIRQKKEYERLKASLTNIEQPVTADPVCPPGQVYDKSLGKCVDVATGEEEVVKKKKKVTPTPLPVKDCTFPVKLNNKCTQIGDLQKKLMELIPSANTYLAKFGGQDKIYGKGTAAVVNIVWGYLSGQSGQALTSDLTQDMYDQLMALNSTDIDTTSIIFEGSYGRYYFDDFEEMEIDEKIQEREEIKGSPILSFEDFYSVIEESYSFRKLDEENVFDRLRGKSEETPGAKAVVPDPNIGKKKIVDNCVKKSLEQGKVLDCVGATGGATGETGTTGETGATGEEMKWKGLKPVDDGTYAVLYDESWGEWFGDVAKGALVAGIIIGVGVATWGVGLAIAAPGAVTAAGVASGIGTAATLGTTAAGGLSAAAGATILWGGGIIGGTTIAKWAGSDRKTVGVLVFNGFIEEIAVRAMARGLYNSLGGTVSSQDLLAIYSTLILCRGTFTDTGDGKAVSVWSLVKRQYSSFGGGSLEGDIASITSGGAGGFFKDMVTDMDTIPSFPKSFKTRNPINGTPIEFENAKDACVAAVGKLNSNEPKLSENLKYITEDDLEKLSESMEEITDAVVAAAPGAKAEGEEESEA
jgi:hypothetical protein